MADGAGSLLIRSGLIGDRELRTAREARADQGGTVGEYLVLLAEADDEALTSFYHSRLMVPLVDPNQLARIPARVISKIPEDMATEFRVIPVSLDREQNLTLAMSDPTDTHAIDEISFFTGYYVMRAVATQRQIAWCLAHYYGFVSPLGETLLQAPEKPEEPEPSPADGVPVTRRRGPGPITRKVEASRHRVRPPPADTGEVSIVADTPPADADTPPADADTREFEEEPRTGPMKPPQRAPTQEPNPPELDPRAGEVEVQTESAAIPSSSQESLPAVMIDVDSDGDPIQTITEETEDDEVVILDRPARSSSQPPPAEATEPPADKSEGDSVVVLDTPKRRRRTTKRTRLGLGIIPAAPPPRRTKQEPKPETEVEDDAPTPADGVPRPVEDADTEANATARYKRIEYDEAAWDDADEFGPPGTTIPPPYLGAMPDSGSTGPHNAIPLNVSDEDSSGLSVPVEVPADPVASLANEMSEAADTERELETSATRLVETLRALDAATTRDAVVEALVDHLAKSFGRATFLVVRRGDLVPFRSKGNGRLAANWKNAALPLATPSTLRDVIQTRLPFRGEATDQTSRNFFATIFGSAPGEILLVPCAVRERPVGVLCGTERRERIFHEHLSVVTRGAGDAFERILKARKQ